jgi:high frequency lysogenization protein
VSRLRDQTLALAGLFQAGRLVQQLARTGRAPPQALRTSLESVLKLDAPSTEAVFGGAAGLRLGLEILRDRLTGSTDPADLEVARYVVSMLHLANELRKLPDMQAAIRRGIAAIGEAGAARNEPEVLNALAERLAELYVQTLSTLTPRILVNGEQGHLANPVVVAQVRAALFAGIRAAWLWRQLGGSRWQLLFGRRQLAEEAGRILEALLVG